MRAHSLRRPQARRHRRYVERDRAATATSRIAGIGHARRMPVADAANLQHHVMIEAVENHMPRGRSSSTRSAPSMEAFAARTIAERGVQLIGTAHGQDARESPDEPDARRSHGRHQRGHALRRRSAPPRHAQDRSRTQGAADVRRPDRDSTNAIGSRSITNVGRRRRLAACAAISRSPRCGSARRAATIADRPGSDAGSRVAQGAAGAVALGRTEMPSSNRVSAADEELFGDARHDGERDDRQTARASDLPVRRVAQQDRTRDPEPAT